MQELNNNTEPKRFSLFRLSPPVRMLIYLPIVAAILYFTLRQLEFLVTYHPLGYTPGPEWTPPANGEDVWIRTAGGERIHAWFVRAAEQPAAAAVLYCHGNGGNLTNVGWIAEELSKRGFDAVVFDYRGYGRSDGKLADEWGLYADTDAVYDYLIRERGAKPERLVVYGQSLGSTAAIDLASRKRCAAVIVESGLSSASEMGAIAFPWLPRWLHSLAKNRFESARKIASVNCPVLITHGTMDEVIPVEQGRRLYESAREPKRLVIVEGGDHNLAGAGGDRYLDSISDFIHEVVAVK
ncbi:MAG: alpha/beta hydrolase [Blastocatellia bacterium]